MPAPRSTSNPKAIKPSNRQSDEIDSKYQTGITRCQTREKRTRKGVVFVGRRYVRLPKRPCFCTHALKGKNSENWWIGPCSTGDDTSFTSKPRYMKMHRKAKNRRYEFQIFFRVFRPYEALFERNDWRDLIFEVRNKNILKEHGYFLGMARRVSWTEEGSARERKACDASILWGNSSRSQSACPPWGRLLIFTAVNYDASSPAAAQKLATSVLQKKTCWLIEVAEGGPTHLYMEFWKNFVGLYDRPRPLRPVAAIQH